ncbi:MAG: hypothetical protein ACFCVK_10005 [Acidimicrobiales bacterium]
MVDISTDNTFLVRVRMIDRPGALGAIASRIGAVRGDLVGIEIMERRNGFVIDELQVALPAGDLCDLMVRELDDIDDVTVEDVHPCAQSLHDPQLTAFEVVDILIGADSTDELLWSLSAHTRRTIRTAWVCVVDDGGQILAGSGPVPEERWLGRLLDAERAMARRPADGGEVPLDADHLLWMPLPMAGLTLVAGRSALPFRSRERQKAAAMARVAGTWYQRLKERSRLTGMLAHPSLGTPVRVDHPA